MILLILGGVVGGGVTFLALWPFGGVLAFLAAPFGASLLALVAGSYLAWMRTKDHRRGESGSDETDRMIAALNHAAEAGRKHNSDCQIKSRVA
jgi:hypothetical protein